MSDAMQLPASVPYEEALKHLGGNRFNILLILLCGLSQFISIVQTFNMGYILPSAGCELNLSTDNKGLLNSASFIGMIVSSQVWGFVADTRGRRAIIGVTLLGDSLCAIGFSFAPSLWILLFGRFLGGIFVAGHSAVSMAYLGEFMDEQKRTRAFAWMGFCIGLGCGALPCIALMIIPQSWSWLLPFHFRYTSWRIFMAVCGLPGIITALIFLLKMPESPKHLIVLEKKEQALESLRYIYNFNTGRPKKEYPVKMITLDNDEFAKTTNKKNYFTEQIKPLFKPPYARDTALLCTIMCGVYISANGLYMWLAEIFHRLQLAGDSSKTVCQVIDAARDVLANYTQSEVLECGDSALHVNSGVFWRVLIIDSSIILGMVVYGFVIWAFGKQITLVGSMLVMASSGIVIFFVTGDFQLILSLSIFMILSEFANIIIINIVVDIYPTYLRGMAVCLAYMMNRLGTVLGNILMGKILDIQCLAVFGVIAGLNFVCAGLSLLLNKLVKSKSKK